MPLQVVGKGYSWVNRFAELDALAKGQLRWLAIEAGKVLREQVEAEGLVDSGLLRQKIGQARMVDEYLWVVPAFSEVGDPAQPAPRGTIREFLEWYRGEREREREGRAKATERERRARARDWQVGRPRAGAVRMALAGRRIRLRQSELRRAYREYHTYIEEMGKDTAKVRGIYSGYLTGRISRFESTTGGRATDYMMYNMGKLGKTRGRQIRAHITALEREYRKLRREQRVVVASYKAVKRSKSARIIGKVYSEKLVGLQNYIRKVRSVYELVKDTKLGIGRFPQGRTRWESLSFTQGWTKVLQQVGRESRETRVRVERTIAKYEEARLRRRANAIFSEMMAAGRRRQRKLTWRDVINPRQKKKR